MTEPWRPQEEQWRTVDWSFPVVGSAKFFSDEEMKFDPSSAFGAQVIALHGEVKGPDENGDFRVRVHDAGDVFEVILSGRVMEQANLALNMGQDRRTLYLAASVLRSPKAAFKERMAQLERAARELLPRIYPNKVV